MVWCVCNIGSFHLLNKRAICFVCVTRWNPIIFNHVTTIQDQSPPSRKRTLKTCSGDANEVILTCLERARVCMCAYISLTVHIVTFHI